MDIIKQWLESIDEPFGDTFTKEKTIENIV